MDNQTLTIGQLAKRVGLRTSALRYYEQQGLLEPVGRTESGYRLYAPKAEQTLRLIQRAQRLGFALTDIRTFLNGWKNGDLSNHAITQTAENRYLELERQVTELLVLQHELELFLNDMHERQGEEEMQPTAGLFQQLIERVCANPVNQPATPTLNWLMEYTGCILATADAEALIAVLRGQHIHIWQEGARYHILVVSSDPAVGEALRALAALEAGCHTHPHQTSTFTHDNEGYLLVAKGEHAFIFARLFLALGQENT